MSSKRGDKEFLADIQDALQQIQGYTANYTHARFAEMDSSFERRHEVPYCLLGEQGLPAMGAIDLVYRGAGDRWDIIELKTDRIENDAQLTEQKLKYSKQVIRYRGAVRRLLGQSVESWLCFLNYGSSIQWVQVVPAP